MKNLFKTIRNYHLSFGKYYPHSTLNYYYKIKDLLKYQEKVKELLKELAIPETYYLGYLNFFKKAYSLVKKKRFFILEDLIKKEVLKNKLEKEVLKAIYFLLLKSEKKILKMNKGNIF
jgi:hypothetical protein